MQRDDADQLTARDFEGPASLPLRPLDRTETDQPRRLGVDVVGFEIKVIARRVIDGLYGGDQAGTASGTAMNCSSSDSGRVGPPTAADQNVADLAACSMGTSMSRVDTRLRCTRRS